MSYEHRGKCIDSMSRSQKNRITRTLKSKIEKALFFADSYGLRPTSVKLCNSDGDPVSVQLDLVEIYSVSAETIINDPFSYSENVYR